MKRQSKLLEAKAIVSHSARSLEIQLDRLNLSKQDKAFIERELTQLLSNAHVLVSKLEALSTTNNLKGGEK